MDEERQSTSGDDPALMGRVVLVTGAAQGMGAACALRLALSGMHVVLVDRQGDALAAVEQRLRDESFDATAVTADITQVKDVQRCVDQAVKSYGSLDVLVNAAGVLKATRFHDIPPSEWLEVIDVNLNGAFLMSQAASREMRERGWGRIVHFASTAGKTVSTLGGAHYTASKHALLGLTRATALELAPFGITVNAVCPGLIDTEMVRRTVTDPQLRNFAESFPISRLGTPEEVAELVAYLVGPAAGYITGAAIDINGGDLIV